MCAACIDRLNIAVNSRSFGISENRVLANARGELFYSACTLRKVAEQFVIARSGYFGALGHKVASPLGRGPHGMVQGHDHKPNQRDTPERCYEWEFQVLESHAISLF